MELAFRTLMSQSASSFVQALLCSTASVCSITLHLGTSDGALLSAALSLESQRVSSQTQKQHGCTCSYSHWDGLHWISHGLRVQTKTVPSIFNLDGFS